MGAGASDLPPGVSFEQKPAPGIECPNCFARGGRTIYEVDGIPVHSCLLMPSRDVALAYPTGDLALGFCPTCGFLFNTRFDPTVHEYSPDYEETQGFSPTFNTFARRLADGLIEKHDLRGKTALEIGCGKGEFLALLCQLGDMRGVGIDPGYRPERTPADAAARVEFIRDFYGPKYVGLTADFICCRHTLEHIAPTGSFLRDIRTTIGDRRDTLVWFELPDVYRVLREGAFWDIYYEHCTYFTLGSLARLFRRSSFDVTELETVYDDQYLLVTARPADGPTAPRLPEEDDLAAVTEAVDRFGEVCSSIIARWRGLISELAGRGEKVVAWGSGSKGVSFLTTLKFRDEIEYVVDINPHRQGHYMPGTGQRIVAPEFLAEYRPAHVIVMNPIYCDEIRGDLDRVGVRAELHPV